MGLAIARRAAGQDASIEQSARLVMDCADKISVFLATTMFASFLLAPAAAQDIEAGRTGSQACAACHGVDGNSLAGMFPNLAGQSWRYIYIQLRDFKEGRRSNPLMTPMAQPLSRQDMIDLANYLAAQPAKPSTFKADETKIRLGKAKANETLCAMCHLGGFAGQNEIPKVAGQQYELSSSCAISRRANVPTMPAT